MASPMAGLVPFDMKAVRMKICGVIEAAEKRENDVHIPMATPEHAVRYIEFNRV